MFAVVITEKGGAQRRLEFDKNEVTIGRVQGNDIILPKGNVSKRHSRIVLKDNRFIVVDLKSTNGTYVNGRKITSPLVVKSGDKIYIGDFILTLEETAGASAGAFEPGQPSPIPPGPPPVGPAMSGPMPLPGAPMPAMAAPPPLAGPSSLAPMPPLAGAPPMPPPVSASSMSGPPMAAPPPARPSAPPPIPPRAAPAPAPVPPAPAPVMPPGPPPAAPMPPPAPPSAAPMPPPAPRTSHAAPPPMPAAPPPVSMPGGAAERFLEDGPSAMDDHASPPPRVVGTPAPVAPAPVSAAVAAPMGHGIAAAPPAVGPAPIPPAPAPPPAAPVAPAVAPASPPIASPPSVSLPASPPPITASAAPAPSASPASVPSIPQGAAVHSSSQAALSAVVSQAAAAFNPYDVATPALEGDPRRAAARRAVESAIESAAASGMSLDRDKVASAALEELVGLGAIGAIVADTAVRGAVVQGIDGVLVDRGQGLAPHDGCFSSVEALTVIVGRMVAMAGGYFDRNKPIHEGTLPNGVHFHAVLPPVAVGGPVVELRRLQRGAVTGEQLVARGVLSSDILDLLRRAVRVRKGVAVVGARDAGVSQLVSAVANLGAPDERILAIEVVPDLELASPEAVRLTAAAGATFESVIEQGGRMHADRVVIDGVRGGEALAALVTAASRTGAVLGVHSQGGPDALAHLVALAAIGGGARDALPALVGSAIGIVVRMARAGDGRPRVESVGEVRVSESGATLVELFGSNFAATGQSAGF